jgi:NAD(P)H dehydrogenase (quinone)
MRVLWVFAHPERRSLNGALLDDGLRALEEFGHEHRVSDLYGMGFSPVVGPADFGGHRGERLSVGDAQEHAHRTGTLAADIRAEQEKLAWADALVLQFPLWWFGPPAILKGWFDRVLVQGFAFGLRDDRGRPRRYGDGGLAGKRALVVTTVGGREEGFGARGVHGHLEHVLWPLLHGTLWYTGIAPLPPFAVHAADRMTDAGREAHARALRARLRSLPDAAPLAYRHEAGGDYDENLVLRPGLAAGSGGGLDVHRA